MQENKIILIHVGNFCECGPGNGVAPPLGTIYLGSYLDKHGFRVTLLDTRLHDKSAFYPELAKDIQNSIIVGLSVMTPLVKEGLEITNFIKVLKPAIPIVWGGFHATLFPESTLGNKNIDYVIMGEGEKGLLALVEYICQKKDIGDVTNLVFKRKDTIIKNEISHGEDLDVIGIPAYHMLDFSPYIEKSNFTLKTKIDILTSRGCKARCAFCVNSIIHKSMWRPESIQQTLDNIDAVIERYKPEHICFTDEDFFCDISRVKQLLPEIKKRGLNWDANCRAYHFRKGYLDDTMLSEMYESGCRGLRFGLESGSQRILNMLNKGLTPEQSLHAIMFGMPDETLDDVLKTFDLILKIFRINPAIDILGPQIFRPYPGSFLFNKCIEKGLRVPKDLDSWSNFFIYDFAIIDKHNYPWLSKPEDFRKASLCRAYLGKRFLPIWLRYIIVKFHIITRLTFIDLDYVIFKFCKSIAKRLKIKKA